MTDQSFKNHTRFVPAFHFFVLPVLVINIGTQLYWWIKLGFIPLHFFTVLLSVALLLGIVYGRLFALSVQDRLIRLEEQIRYERVLPEELRWRADELSVSQFVSLRFASDDELPLLVGKVLDEKLAVRKTIKQLIKNWKPENFRA